MRKKTPMVNSLRMTKYPPFHTQNKWNIIIYKNVVVRWR
jgi:hypothetical protein